MVTKEDAQPPNPTASRSTTSSVGSEASSVARPPAFKVNFCVPVDASSSASSFALYVSRNVADASASGSVTLATSFCKASEKRSNSGVDLDFDGTTGAKL
eukprot:CAMPEP_0171951970 /NCGR_PEP_ID=MMETSP0993-20121228/87328_1 /TAXON_ID=483369 /ORGANISM="non described non described, Strain CCMP2098" /LENGTH=99 /DNA_ID=CAMNT_0012597255 /DNA_START=179 /DNA_END=474 /DNA_ORIENTATION=-